MTNEPTNNPSNPNDMLAKYAGAGRDSIENGVQIPFIRILQKSSAEIDETHPQHAMKKIEGARVGDLYHPVAGLLARPVRFIPVKFTTYYEERQGMEAQGQILRNLPMTVQQDKGYKKDKAIESLQVVSQNNYGEREVQTNRLMKTTVCGVILPDYNNEPAVLKFQSTALVKARELQEAVSRFKYPQAPTISPPVFARNFKLDTQIEKNDKNQTWVGFTFLPGEVIDPSQDSSTLDLCLEFTKESLVPSLQLPAKSVEAIKPSTGDDIF